MRTFDQGNSEQCTPITAAEQALFDGMLLCKRPISPLIEQKAVLMLPSGETCVG